jgi:hypothetical protein
LGNAIGDMLPSAIGVAISPLPIVAVVLMLVTERAHVNGPAFVIGWWVGIGAVGSIVLLAASGAEASDDSQPADWVSILKLLLGLLLLLMAVRQWQNRPHSGDPVETPAWMSAIETFGPGKAGGLAAGLGGINPKNLLLVVAGAAAIAQTGISGGEQALAMIIFVLVASLGVMAPVAIYFALGDRSRQMLDELKDWLSYNNGTIMSVLLLVLGVKLVGDAISGLA